MRRLSRALLSVLVVACSFSVTAIFPRSAQALVPPVGAVASTVASFSGQCSGTWMAWYPQGYVNNTTGITGYFYADTYEVDQTVYFWCASTPAGDTCKPITFGHTTNWRGGSVGPFTLISTPGDSGPVTVNLNCGDTQTVTQKAFYYQSQQSFDGKQYDFDANCEWYVDFWVLDVLGDYTSINVEWWSGVYPDSTYR